MLLRRACSFPHLLTTLSFINNDYFMRFACYALTHIWTERLPLVYPITDTYLRQVSNTLQQFRAIHALFWDFASGNRSAFWICVLGTYTSLLISKIRSSVHMLILRRSSSNSSFKRHHYVPSTVGTITTSPSPQYVSLYVMCLYSVCASCLGVLSGKSSDSPVVM